MHQQTPVCSQPHEIETMKHCLQRWLISPPPGLNMMTSTQALSSSCVWPFAPMTSQLSPHTKIERYLASLPKHINLSDIHWPYQDFPSIWGTGRPKIQMLCRQWQWCCCQQWQQWRHHQMLPQRLAAKLSDSHHCRSLSTLNHLRNNKP